MLVIEEFSDQLHRMAIIAEFRRWHRGDGTGRQQSPQQIEDLALSIPRRVPQENRRFRIRVLGAVANRRRAGDLGDEIDFILCVSVLR